MSASRPPRWAAAAERAGRACVAAALAAIGLAASVANAQRPPPPSALPRVTPIYSIAAGSPSPFLPSDILGPNRLTGSAGVLFPSAAFGLLPADDTGGRSGTRCSSRWS